jgi:hypothetical protein
MRLFVFAIIGLALSPLSFPAMAQRGGGGHGARSGASGSAPGSLPSDESVDLSRALADQATEVQREQFESAVKKTEAARKLVGTLQQSAAKPGEPTVTAAALRGALDDMIPSNENEKVQNK